MHVNSTRSRQNLLRCRPRSLRHLPAEYKFLFETPRPAQKVKTQPAEQEPMSLKPDPVLSMRKARCTKSAAGAGFTIPANTLHNRFGLHTKTPHPKLATDR